MANTDRRRILADMHWLLYSQPILTSSSDQFDFSEAQKKLILESLANVPDLPESIPLRLGRHFENLFELALRLAFPQAEIIRGLKLFEGKNNVGEIDFILKRKNLPTIQIEIAVKFYLQLHTTQTLSDFVGPNKHDSLNAKLEKLQRPPRRELLEFPVDKSLFFLKGALFYPFEKSDIQASIYPFLNQDHGRSFWIASDRVMFLREKFPNLQFIRVLQRNEWITPSTFLNNLFEKLKIESFQKLDFDKTQYVAFLNWEGEEVTRGFIVTKGCGFPH